MNKDIAPTRYDLVAQLLHWAMAGILLYLIFFSQYEDVPDAVMEGRIELHAGLGLFVVLLGLFRFYWRQTRPRPSEMSDAPRWQNLAARYTHQAFYGLFLLAPAAGVVLAGLVAYPVRIFGFVEISDWLSDNKEAAEFVNSVHGFTADLILYLFIIHVAAAIYHQFIKRDGLIWRMTPVGHSRLNNASKHRMMVGQKED